MPTQDDYYFWRGALANNFPYAMRDGAFECGFWRTRGRDRKWSPVAIWKDEKGALQIKVGSALVTPDSFAGRWNFTWQNPVSHEDYTFFMAEGRWRGEVAGLGDNAPPDEFQLLKENIEDQAAQALKWLADHKDIQSQEDADTAANYRDSLNKLGKKADACRKADKEPLALQVKQIDAKYGIIVKAAGDAAEALRTALTGYMRRKEAEERARIAEERRKAEGERKRQEDERAALAAKDIALAAIEPELPPLPEPEKPAAIRVGGQLGRATGFRTVYKAEIEDYAKALAHFSEHPDIRAAVERLCNAEARSKTRKDIPGVKFKEEKVAA